MQLNAEVLCGFVAGPDAKKRSDSSDHNAADAKHVAAVQHCAQPAAQSAENCDADKNHKLHEVSLT